MPHIDLPEGFPGIRGPMAFSPATTKPLQELAEVLLHAPNTLSSGERELIATYVSYQNDYRATEVTAHRFVARPSRPCARAGRPCHDGEFRK